MSINLPISTDFAGLGSLRAAASTNGPDATRETARQFEALFVQMMLKSMRDASAILGEDRNTDYEEMFDREVSMQLTAQKGIGLADVMLRQLAPPEGGAGGPNGIAKADDVTTGMTDLPAPIRQDFRPTDRDDFVRRIWPYAERAAQRLGTEPRALVAQAALESGWGQKQMRDHQGVSSNNLFGIKADGRWTGARLAARTVEFTDGIARTQTDKFRAYPTLAAGFDDYVDFLKTNPRYGLTEPTELNADDYVRHLEAAGYATDPRYAEKIQGIMNSDRFNAAISNIKPGGPVPKYL
ncbi:MAG: glucosaminidase domain-containing protein [Gammaproteobacteria bacterium]